MAITEAQLGHGDVRVQDYLDDRLQTGADLDSLDSLLENVRTQQGLLRKQVFHSASYVNQALNHCSLSKQRKIMPKLLKKRSDMQQDFERKQMLSISNKPTLIGHL